MGNGGAKELIFMTHGHELSLGNTDRSGSAEQKGIKGRKKWDSCNSRIHKIYFKNKNKKIKKLFGRCMS